MAITKLNTYEIGVNADLSNALNNIDYNRSGIDTTVLTAEAGTVTVKKGFLLEVSGNLYTSSADISITADDINSHIAFDPISFSFSLESTIGTFDETKNGYYIGEKRVIKWSFKEDGTTSSLIQGMSAGTAKTQKSGVMIGRHVASNGIRSVGIGGEITVTGDGSVAVGEYAEVTGDQSIAVGYKSKASGSFSQVVGDYAEASGNFATASGHLAKASGLEGVAVGSDTEAAGEISVAVGWGAEANADRAIAIGGLADAQGEDSIAIGYEAVAARGEFVWTGEQSKSGALSLQVTAVPAGTTTLPAGHYIMSNQTSLADVSVQANFSAGWATIEQMTSTGNATASFFSDGVNFRLNNTTGITATVEYYKW